VIPIYKVGWLRPCPIGDGTSVPQPCAPLNMDVIIFQLYCPDWMRTDDHETKRVQYRCMDCYAASGNPEAFTTGSAFATRMKDGPTDKQQGQMIDHARQHSIMWSWAKSLEGK
jgi:hypothetical protein